MSNEQPPCLRSTIYPRFDLVPAQQWQRVVGDDGTVAMDLRLLGAFQRSMVGQCKCWAVIIYDESATAIAAAALCLFRVDGTDSTSRRLQKVADTIRKIWPRFLRFNVLFCGLPVPSGESHLRMVAGADPSLVLRELNRVMNELATQHKARLLVVKELCQEQAGLFSILERLRYIRVDIPPLHIVSGRFADFDSYPAALKTRYRAKPNRSIRKL